MESGACRSVRELTDLLAVVSSAPSAEAAFAATVAHAAGAFGADLAAVLGSGRLLAGVGQVGGLLPEAELLTTVGDCNGHLDVPDVGQYAVLAEPIEVLPGGSLIVARSAERPYDDDERRLLGGPVRSDEALLRVAEVVFLEQLAADHIEGRGGRLQRKDEVGITAGLGDRRSSALCPTDRGLDVEQGLVDLPHRGLTGDLLGCPLGRCLRLRGRDAGLVGGCQAEPLALPHEGPRRGSSGRTDSSTLTTATDRLAL